MEGPIYITGTIHHQCNCPIKYHLNADYSTGTLKLVLGNHWYFETCPWKSLHQQQILLLVLIME